MKKTLLLTFLVGCFVQPAMAQMSMQDQIAAVRAAEIQIEQLEAQKTQEAALVAKRAADIQRRAAIAKQKAKAVAHQKEEGRQAKLDAYTDQERELAIELKKLDVEMKRVELEHSREKLNQLKVQTENMRHQK